MVFFRSFLLFVFLIPLSQYMSSAALVLLLVASFVLPGRLAMVAEVGKRSWDSLLFLAVLILGLSYTQDKSSGWATIETSLSLVAIPLVMSRTGNLGPRQLQQVFLAFTGGLFLAVAICLVNATYRFSHGEGTSVFFFNDLTAILGFQPTYVAYYLVASITFGLYLMYYERPLVSIRWLVLVEFLLFGALLLTGGITAQVSIVYVLAFFLLKYLLEVKTRTQTITFVIVCLLTVGMFAFNELRHVDPSGFTLDDSWERLNVWEAALKTDTNPWLGVGTGDAASALNAYFSSHDMAKYAASNLNPHNQFISIYLSNGLLGLGSFLLLLIRPIYLSVQRSNALGALIFFPFVIYGITEVYLGRYQGVVFFALLRQAFILYYEGLAPSFNLKRA